jgi:hypothetical protein
MIYPFSFENKRPQNSGRPLRNNQRFFCFTSDDVIDQSKLTSLQTDKISQQPGNCENRNDPDLVQVFLKKWWVESDFKAPNLPLSLWLYVKIIAFHKIEENTAKICENDHQHHHLPGFVHTICNNGLNIECVLTQNYIAKKTKLKKV